MKVILIEDEPDSLEGMQRAAESIDDIAFAIFAANHTEEAYRIIEAERPELIVTDIMLPGMTGLDLVERVVHADYSPFVIVVSGYSDFDYARQSIRLGAVDYLLKPYRTEELVDKIRNSLVRIQEKQARALEIHSQQSFAEIGLRSMRDEFLLSLCLKETVLEEHLYHRLRLWGLEWLADKFYTVFVMDTKGFPDGKPPSSPFALQTFAIGNIVHDCIEGFHPSLLFKDPKQRWVVITGYADTDSIAVELAEHVKRFHKINLAAGRSGKKTSFELLHSAYQEALTSFRYHTLSTGGESAETMPDEPDSRVEEWAPDLMAVFIETQDKEQLRRGARAFLLDVLRRDVTESREDITRVILNYLSQIHLQMSESRAAELMEIPISIWEKLDGCRTLEEYEQALGSYLVDLAKETDAPRTNSIIERAIRLIDERYTDDNLSLSFLADQLHIHPVWLSHSFKKETGQTYLDYLTDLRIGQAKRLLRETSQKIYEIAENVGYRDLQHFGHLFKKRTGQTPKEYRYGK